MQLVDPLTANHLGMYLKKSAWTFPGFHRTMVDPISPSPTATSSRKPVRYPALTHPSTHPSTIRSSILWPVQDRQTKNDKITKGRRSGILFTQALSCFVDCCLGKASGRYLVRQKLVHQGAVQSGDGLFLTQERTFVKVGSLVLQLAQSH